MSEDDRAAFARAVANYDTPIDPRKELLRCADTIDRLTRERDEARDDATRRHEEMMDAIDAEIAMEARAERAEAALRRIVDKRGYADDPWAIARAALAQKDAAP